MSLPQPKKKQGSAQLTAEYVGIMEKPTTSNKYVGVQPKTKNKRGRKENQTQSMKHNRVMMNTGRDQTKIY